MDFRCTAEGVIVGAAAVAVESQVAVVVDDDRSDREFLSTGWKTASWQYPPAFPSLAVFSSHRCCSIGRYFGTCASTQPPGQEFRLLDTLRD